MRKNLIKNARVRENIYIRSVDDRWWYNCVILDGYCLVSPPIITFTAYQMKRCDNKMARLNDICAL